MKVNIISETKQEFNGVVYYKCGEYYQKKGVRLHRKVWEYHHGQIPKGYHIHHIDGNKNNNSIENLEIKTSKKHISEHIKNERPKEQMLEQIKLMQEKAIEWHKSEDGLKWHSEQGKKNWEKRKINTYTCVQCGKEYQTKHVYPEGMNTFCHNNCKAKFRRAKVKRGEIPR